MNQKRITLVGLVITTMLLVAFGAYRFGLQSGATRASSAQAVERRVLYWYDPMHPEQHFDRPGKSPFMDMELVPAYADRQSSDGVVILDSRLQQRLGVRLATVERKPLALDIAAAGSVEFDDRDVAVVQARANGFIEKLRVRTVLQTVARGDALADLYVPDWIAAQEEFLAVSHMQSDARESLLASAKQRMRLAGMSEEQIAAVERSGAVRPRISLRAPIAGVVSELDAREGMTIANGAPLFRINGIDTVWVVAEIPEAEVSLIAPGTPVIATGIALQGATLKGKVLAILPEVSSGTRTMKARIELPNAKRQLSPGMFVTVHFAAGDSSPKLVVPTEALIVTGTRTVVIVAETDERFRPAAVVTGVEAGGVTEIREGVMEGQRIVTSAQFLIDSEANLKAATERMSGSSDASSNAPTQPQSMRRSEAEGAASRGRGEHK